MCERAYLRYVSPAYLIRLLMIVALTLSPLVALGTAPASAMVNHAAMSADASQITSHQMASHDMAGETAAATIADCKNSSGNSKDGPCPSADCLVACAAVSAIPAVGGQLEPQSMVHNLSRQPALVALPHGFMPKAATPPPRLLKI